MNTAKINSAPEGYRPIILAALADAGGSQFERIEHILHHVTVTVDGSFNPYSPIYIETLDWLIRNSARVPGFTFSTDTFTWVSPVETLPAGVHGRPWREWREINHGRNQQLMDEWIHDSH